MSSHNVNIFTSFQSRDMYDTQQLLANGKQINASVNIVPSNQTAMVLKHDVFDITKLSITSNGIELPAFDIFPVKYVGEPVQFVAQLLDYNDCVVRDYPLLPLSCFTFSLSSSQGEILNNVFFTSNFGTLSSLTQGGFFKGIFVSSQSAIDVCIFAKYLSDFHSLTAYSNTFSVYPSGGLYNLRKINENFDQTQAYKSLIFQPILVDQTMLFDKFLGQIVGNANSDPNTLGIEVYEKIANFVENTQDIDYCNISYLKSLLNMINANYQNFDLAWPASLKRLADILSVKHKKLFGEVNQFQGNFDKKGFTHSDRYGINRGAELDINTTILSAGSAINPSQIIAYEKFSKIYTPVSTLLTLSSYTSVVANVSTYPLSTFDPSWGWNLVLPQNVQGAGIADYYKFYVFIPTVEGSLLQKFIDFDNNNNTLTRTNSSYNEYIKQGGIMDNILLHNIYTGFEILS